MNNCYNCDHWCGAWFKDKFGISCCERDGGGGKDVAELVDCCSHHEEVFRHG